MPAQVPSAGVPVWLRMKLRASKALAGVGLLNTAGSVFLEKRLVAPTPAAEYLYFPIEDRAQTGGIAIYTYDKAVPADIEVSEVSVIW